MQKLTIRKRRDRNNQQCRTLVYTTERLFKDLEGKVPEKEIAEIKGKIMELKELMKPAEKDVASIKKKTDEINELVQKMSTELYQKAGAQHQHGQPGQEDAQSYKDDNVVDADYEVRTTKGQGIKKPLVLFFMSNHHVFGYASLIHEGIRNS